MTAHHFPDFESDTLEFALLDRYDDGTATSEERAQVNAWFETHRRFAQRSHPSPEMIAQQMKMFVREDQKTLLAAFKSGDFRSIQRPRAYVIASLMACVLILALGFQLGEQRLGMRLANQASEYATGPGQQSTITLPDGSRVTLNVASRIQIPANYATGNRVVRLSGEALFTVTHQRGTPFTVIAGPSTTRVLGTNFVVRHYATDSTAIVAVRDGKVDVNARVVTAMQEVVVSQYQTGPATTTTTDRFGVERGTLVLHGVTLRDAIPDLNRWYNATIQVSDSTLLSQHIVGEFIAGSVADLIQILEWTMPVRVVRDRQTLTLHPKG